MTLKYLVAEQQPNQYFFRVLMDDTKVNADGSPIPEYVVEYNWTLQAPAGVDTQTYLNNIKVEIQGLVNYQLNLMQLAQQQTQTPIPLAGF